MALWETCHDAEGRRFYFNTETEESVWERPPELGDVDSDDDLRAELGLQTAVPGQFDDAAWGDGGSPPSNQTEPARGADPEKQRGKKGHAKGRRGRRSPKSKRGAKAAARAAAAAIAAAVTVDVALSKLEVRRRVFPGPV